MTKTLKSAALALGLSLLAGGALAADKMDCCCKDKDGKMSCCDKMKDKADAAKPGDAKPATPSHEEHKH